VIPLPILCNAAYSSTALTSETGCHRAARFPRCRIQTVTNKTACVMVMAALKVAPDCPYPTGSQLHCSSACSASVGRLAPRTRVMGASPPHSRRRTMQFVLGASSGWAFHDRHESPCSACGFAPSPMMYTPGPSLQRPLRITTYNVPGSRTFILLQAIKDTVTNASPVVTYAWN
jgi:hypothetical protein